MVKLRISIMIFISIATLHVSAIEIKKDFRQYYPERGAADIAPCSDWNEGMYSGNGTMGAVLFGTPDNTHISISHEKFFLPLGTNEYLPEFGPYLPEMRKIIDRGPEASDEAQTFFYEKFTELGFGGFAWTNPFHKAFNLSISINKSDVERSKYLRTTNFETGEVSTYWKNKQNGKSYSTQMFVSRVDSLLVFKIEGDSPISADIYLSDYVNDKVIPEISGDENYLYFHSLYKYNKKDFKGYDGIVKVQHTGGTQIFNPQNNTITVEGAKQVLIYARVAPNPTTESLADNLKASVSSKIGSYDALLNRHIRIHAEMFNRVKPYLVSDSIRMAKTSTELLSEARAKNILTPALVEKMYDAGRYMAISSTGEWGPNLQGVWIGDWSPRWCGDYTTDTNVQLAIGSAMSGDLPEVYLALFNYFDTLMDGFRENAKAFYGCRGICMGPRHSDTGRNLHFGSGGSYPGQAWTAGAGWFSHFYYDYYLYTGDQTFLRERAYPFMREAALFYEDFIYLDENGKCKFSPSYSAENKGVCYNSTMDIMVCRELFTNLIKVCKILKIEKQNIRKWEKLLTQLPEYRINKDGALAEWIPKEFAVWDDTYQHRHLSHLYGTYVSHEISPDGNPKLYKAACVALDKKMNTGYISETHGKMHMCMCAISLRKAEEAWSILKQMPVDHSVYNSLMTSHDPKSKGNKAHNHVLNCDGTGQIPDLINRMLLYSYPGGLDFLPATPNGLNKGEIHGIKARGEITINKLIWNVDDGTLAVEMTSTKDQDVLIRMPSHKSIRLIEGKGKYETDGISVRLPKNAPIKLSFSYTL